VGPVGAVFRILDANLNRAREALRVAEDVARFQLDDAPLAAALKKLRHDVDRPARPRYAALLAARDSKADVGRDGDLPSGPRSLRETAAANLKRAQEALRVVEEVAKGRVPPLSAAAHRARFALYEVERRFGDPRARLAAARLYVLLDPSVTRRPLDRVAREAVAGGADVLQLRMKPRIDLALARAIRAAVPDALFIVNDDPAAAIASGADGVHLGLEDAPIATAKSLGCGIVGATSHSLAEAKRAVARGADYVSVGPMFATALKPHLAPKGAEYLAGVKKLKVPFFCIGGITASNVRRSMERVAVCSAVIAAPDVRGAASRLRRRLAGR
jgi:thiamine-phosphate pyrophosphorylase